MADEVDAVVSPRMVSDPGALRFFSDFGDRLRAGAGADPGPGGAVSATAR
jgi:hypothetical protein